MTTQIEIPTRSDIQQYTIRVDLEDGTWNFRFHFNNRDSHWYLHIYDTAMVPLLTTALVVNWSLIGRFVKTTLPPGRLVLVDLEGKESECGELDLGTRCVLMYETSI